jgi:ATP/maltotriose-dependent transcriptional regulator MalT
MAPSPAPSPSAASAQHALLATKLRAPHPRTGRVPRPRLVRRLQAATECELVLVCGPAGFGKSSLLAEWVRGDRRPVAWLSLDAGDNDPVRFWRHVTAALDGVHPGVADRVGPVVPGAAAIPFAGVVTALVNAFAVAVDDVALVIDDYHVVASPDVHRSLEFLLDHLPSALRMVLASRSDPPLPLARLRARGQLAELRAGDLRFTREEAAELLRTEVGSHLPDGVVAALGERTEGWAAGLHLAALSLSGRPDVARFVAEFSGSHRFVLDYLTEEVLERQPAELRTFLLETSVLDRLCGPLCDAVTGRPDAQQLLESVERASLFLIPLDEERGWWRYHHLFADLLRANLQAQFPDRVPELHRAAADWYASHGLPDDAVRHALSAGDTARAAWLVEEHLEEQVWRRAEGATLAAWLAALPTAEIHRRPLLTLGQAVAALMTGRLDEVEPLLAVAERALDHTPAEPYHASLDRRFSVLANIPAGIAVCRADLARMHGDAAAEQAAAREALAHVTAQDELLSTVARYHVAFADGLAGRVVVAEHALGGLFAERVAAEQHDLVMRAAFDLGAVQQARGRLGAAQRTYEQALAVGEGAGPSAGMAHVGLAEVHFERDELANAHRHVTTGIEQCRRLAYLPALVEGLITLARLRRADGDPAGALAAVDEADRAMPQALVDLRIRLSALRAYFAVARGDLAEATQWARASGLAVDDEPVYLREPEYRVLARLMIAEQDPASALALLERWQTLARVQGRAVSMLRLRVLEMLAHNAAGDRTAALRALAAALALAAPEGYVRVLLDEGPTAAALLRELMVGRRLEQLGARPVPPEFLDRLTDAFDRHGTRILPL